MSITKPDEQKLASGRFKVSTCEVNTCSNHELLHRVNGSFICGICLDRIGEVALQGNGFVTIKGGN